MRPSRPPPLPSFESFENARLRRSISPARQVAWLVTSLACLAACTPSATKTEPSRTSPAHDSEHEVAAPATASAAAMPSAPAVSAEATPRHRRPFEIHNFCTDVATIVFGEDPKAAGADRRTVAASSSVDGPRDDGGNQTVWLLDEKGEGLIRVRVTRGIHRVDIGRSCHTLDAH